MTSSHLFNISADIPLDIFPIELQEEIFSHLSPKNLLSLMLTCKTFNSTIVRNQHLMRNFSVRISKLLKSPCESHRMYTRVIVDRWLSQTNLETIKKSFINMSQSVKVIELEGFQSFGLFAALSGFESLIEMCGRFETILMTKSESDGGVHQKTIEALHRPSNLKSQQKAPKALHVFNPANSELKNLPNLPQISELFMHEGMTFSYGSLIEVFEIKRMTIKKIAFNYTSRCNTTLSSNLNQMKDLEELIFLDCNVVLSLNFSRLKLLKLTRCIVNQSIEENLDFINESSKIDELHIEECKNYLWIEKILKSDHKISNLKIINMNLPARYYKLIKNVEDRLENLILENVTFEL